jgi:hypothetical protein
LLELADAAVGLPDAGTVVLPDVGAVELLPAWEGGGPLGSGVATSRYRIALFPTQHTPR